MLRPSSESMPSSLNVLDSETRPSASFCVLVMTRMTRSATFSGMGSCRSLPLQQQQFRTESRSHGRHHAIGAGRLPAVQQELLEDQQHGGRRQVARAPEAGPGRIQRARPAIAGPRRSPPGCAVRPCAESSCRRRRGSAPRLPRNASTSAAKNCSTTSGTSRDSTMRKPFSEMSQPITCSVSG